MSPDEIGEVRRLLGNYRRHGERLAGEASRWLALTDDELMAAWPKKLAKHRGWGDTKSPARYLEPKVETES